MDTTTLDFNTLTLLVAIMGSTLTVSAQQKSRLALTETRVAAGASGWRW